MFQQLIKVGYGKYEKERDSFLKYGIIVIESDRELEEIQCLLAAEGLCELLLGSKFDKSALSDPLVTTKIDDFTPRWGDIESVNDMYDYSYMYPMCVVQDLSDRLKVWYLSNKCIDNTNGFLDDCISMGVCEVMGIYGVKPMWDRLK